MTEPAELLLCPCCSVPPHLYERPGWHLAIRTSKIRGERWWFYRGCGHAQAVSPGGMFTDAQRVELALKWNVEARRLLDEKLERWSPEQAARLRQLLEPETLLRALAQAGNW